MQTEFEKLLKEASDLVGRPVDVDRTKDGAFIVLYMCFGKKPPPKGKTREEALVNFIAYIKSNRSVDPGTEEEFQMVQDLVAADGKGVEP